VLTVTYDSDLNTLLRARVFDKLGIPSGQLTWRSSLLRTTPLTNPITNVTSARRELSSGMNASVDAMARVGLLFLRKGVWGTEQIISSASVDLVQTPQSSVISLTNPLSTTFPDAQAHYGLLWWTNKDGAIPNLPTDAYWAWGLGESLIVVVPSLDLVVARAGVPDQQPDRGSNRAWNFGWDGKYSVLAPFLTPIGQAATP
ncbi:MAG TPA: hypothetical protein VJS42_03505, partial [Steroidobacteraceae bacterium]|nr:hypothetical protein [Steroidobacteraceae bacterium]